MTTSLGAPRLIAYDATNPANIPDTAMAILPYADGLFAWPRKQVRRFPIARRRFITVTGNAEIASIFDIETGDGLPEDAPDFIEWRHDLFPHSVPGAIYCNRSTLPAVQHACRGLEFLVWLATLDGTVPTSVGGGGRLVAVQDKGGPDAPYDRSVVLDPSWLHPALR
jgi:hypothetical protein